MNIHDIKRAATAAGSPFFSRPTMQFFGDTMKMFGTRTIDGKVYVYRKPSQTRVPRFWDEIGLSINAMRTAWEFDSKRTFPVVPRDSEVYFKIFGFNQ